MTNKEIGLKERLLGHVEDMECVLKQLAESVAINKEARAYSEQDSGIKRLVQLLRSKDKDLRNDLQLGREHAEREEVIKELEEELRIRNEHIEKLQKCFKDAETVLISAVFQANQKLKSINQANYRKLEPEELIRFAHRISKTNAVAAPLTWQQGDAERPFPTDVEMRQGWLERKPDEPPIPEPAAEVLSVGPSGSGFPAGVAQGPVRAHLSNVVPGPSRGVAQFVGSPQHQPMYGADRPFQYGGVPGAGPLGYPVGGAQGSPGIGPRMVSPQGSPMAMAGPNFPPGPMGAHPGARTMPMSRPPPYPGSPRAWTAQRSPMGAPFQQPPQTSPRGPRAIMQQQFVGGVQTAGMVRSSVVGPAPQQPQSMSSPRLFAPPSPFPGQVHGGRPQSTNPYVGGPAASLSARSKQKPPAAPVVAPPPPAAQTGVKTADVEMMSSDSSSSSSSENNDDE